MLTVARALAVPELALSLVHLADGQRVVGWVATSELADPTPYLQGHELLLTTGLETAAWDEDWDEYVARLVAADVAALGLGVGLTHEAVPDALVVACQTHGLNLVAVPRPTAFVAISRAVAALLDEEAEHAAQQALEAQRLLIRAALRGEEAAVLRQLGKLVGGTAAVVDAAGTDAALASRPASTVVHPLGVGGRPQTWLAVTTPGPLQDPHRSAVSTAVALLTLALERRGERRAHDRAIRARAIRLLLDGDADTAAVLLDTLGAVVPGGALRVLRLRGPREALDEVLDTVEGPPDLAAMLDGEVVLICTDRRSASTAERAAARGVRVGVGPATQPTGLGRSHEAAGHALTALSEATVAAWDDVMGGGVLALLGDGAATYADQFLTPLGDDPALIGTLGAYLDHHGSVGDTAVALGVHRNTVRNRLRQVEDALGRSLDDPHVRVDAWVAVQAHRTR
jgi:purine catabolism regulator